MSIDPIALGLKVTGHSGRWYYTRCPFHDDRSTSAEFNVLNGVFYCFTCDFSCSAAFLAKELDGAVESVPEDLILFEKEEYEWHQFLTMPLAFDNCYLRSRKITNEQIEEFEIRASENRIVFICKMNDQPTGIVIRKTDGGFPRYQKLGNVSLWPEKLVSKSLILVEGVFGALRARQAGYEAFALLRASPTSDALRAINGRQVTGFLDDDFAGWIGALKLFKIGAKLAFPGEVDELPLKTLRQRIDSAVFERSYFVKKLKRAGHFKALRRLNRLEITKNQKKHQYEKVF